jgi:hypothetical protein
LRPCPTPPTKYATTMKPNTSQNGATNLPSPWTTTPTSVAVASPANVTRRAMTFEPTSMPSVQALNTTPIPMFSTPRTYSV